MTKARIKYGWTSNELMAVMVVTPEKERNLRDYLPPEWGFIHKEHDFAGTAKAGINYDERKILCTPDQEVFLEEEKLANHAVIILQIARAHQNRYEYGSPAMKNYLSSGKLEKNVEEVLEELYRSDQVAVERAIDVGQQLAKDGFELVPPERLQELLQNALVGRMREYYDILNEKGLGDGRLVKTFHKEGGPDFAFYYW